MQQKYDQWRFITILTTMRSFDFIMSKRSDSVDIITVVNEALARMAEY